MSTVLLRLFGLLLILTAVAVALSRAPDRPVQALVAVLGYTYENYTLDDWLQADAAPWVEAVGADTLLRDTSRSFQWGNRLFNLGTYLAPRYTAHIGFVGFRYRF